jgi:hypothetical protein
VKGKAFPRKLKASTAFLDPDKLMIGKSLGTVNGNLLDALSQRCQDKGQGDVSVFVNFSKHIAISL